MRLATIQQRSIHTDRRTDRHRARSTYSRTTANL